MKYFNNIIFILAIMIISAALICNIIIVKTAKLIQIDFISEMDGFYLDYDNLDDDNKTKLNELLNSNNSTLYARLINSSNDIEIFYGFYGFLINNQSYIIEKNLIPKVLKKSSMSYNFYSKSNSNIEKDKNLCYSILNLLSEKPPLIQNYSDKFIKYLNESLYSIYESNTVFLSNSDKAEILYILLKNNMKNGELLLSNFLEDDNIYKISKEKQLAVLRSFDTCNSPQKYDIVNKLLDINDDDIIKQTLLIIDESFANKGISDKVYNKLNTSNKEIISLAMKKYKLINTNSRTDKDLAKFIQSISDEKLIIEGLNLISEFRDHNIYVYISRFVSTRNYSDKINEAAIKAMINTCYKEKPDRVLKHSNDIILNGQLAGKTAVINFYIKYNIDYEYENVINEFRKSLGNIEYDKLILDYLDFFRFTSGKDILKELSNSENEEIKDKAEKLLDLPVYRD